MPSGDCHGGYVCISGATTATPTDGTTGKICDAGGYCPVGSNSTTLCPPGSYNPTQGLIHVFIAISLKKIHVPFFLPLLIEPYSFFKKIRIPAFLILTVIGKYLGRKILQMS